MPARGACICLDPELPGTSLEARAERGEGKAEAGLGLPTSSGGRSAGTQMRWRKHDQGL